MALSKTQIAEILKNPINAKSIPSLKEVQQRIKFHSQPTFKSGANGYETKFKEWANKLIPNDKFKMFKSLMCFPIDTVALTDEAYQALEKVFDGRDSVYQYTFINEQAAADWEIYRTEVIGEPEIWEIEGFKAMKGEINSIMIVDLAMEQTSERPEPYLYLLDISNVIDYGIKKGQIDWIIFQQPNDKIAIYDDENYRIAKKTNNAITYIVDEVHDIGYCPARFFWSDKVGDTEMRESPITNQVSNLDWLLFFAISKKYSDLYAPYSVVWGVQQDCEFKNEHHECENGYLVDPDGNAVMDGRSLTPCPNCASNIAGVGSFITTQPGTEDNPNTGDPVGRLDVDTGSLEHIVNEIERLSKTFYQATTGNSLESINDQAVNEKQIMSLFESRKQAIYKIKRNFEAAQYWADSTLCRIRYGYEFVNCSINYGTEFYFYSSDVILDLYNKARESKLDHMTLDYLQNDYIETKHRNNPMAKNKSKVLINIEPFRHSTIEEVKKMYDDGHIELNEYILKADMSSLVLQFERERGPIGEYLKETQFDKKIEMITAILYSYIKVPESKQKSDIKQQIEMYGIAVRSGVITPQQQDEEETRKAIGVAAMGDEAIQSWKDDKVRRPITIVGKTETDKKIDQI